jgi:hypothetical protein
MKKSIPFIEWTLFVIAVAITLAPIYSVEWYHTGDGPSHLYSATVLNDLLFHSGAQFGHFYDLHITAVPNTTILILQALMLEVFKPSTVIMVTALLISSSIIFAYIYFIKSINPDHKGISVLILPLIINYFMVMGFFSFLFSLALMFITIGYFNKKIESITNKNIAIIAGLIIINWFTHLTGALFSLGYIAIYFVLLGKKSIGYLGKFSLIAAPLILLTLLFGKDAVHSNKLLFDSFDSLQRVFCDSAPMVCYHPDELGMIRVFQFLILLLFPISLYFFFKNEIKAVRFAPLVFCFLLAIAFFLAPINFFSGGFINYRILFCALLFFCAFLESYSPRYSVILIFPVVVFILFKKNESQMPFVSAYSDDVKSIVENTKFFPQGQGVVALNYSENWLHYNICLYPAIANKIVVLDNPEAITINSIIRWKKEMAPGDDLGSAISSNNPQLKLDYEKKANEKIAGVFRWEYKASNVTTETKYTDSVLASTFSEFENRGGVQVFLRK